MQNLQRTVTPSLLTILNRKPKPQPLLQKSVNYWLYVRKIALSPTKKRFDQTQEFDRQSKIDSKALTFDQRRLLEYLHRGNLSRRFENIELYTLEYFLEKPL